MEIYDNKSIANNFADLFNNISSNNHISGNIIQLRGKTVNNLLNNLSKENPESNKNIEDCRTVNKPFTISELLFTLNQANKKSSPGSDEIHYLLLTKSPEKVKNYFLKLINELWIKQQIPDSWKLSIIKPILKPNLDKNNITSYRPISLISNVSKIMEKMVTNRLTWFLNKNNIIKPSHAGFRKYFSTSDPIIRLKCEIEHVIKEGHITVAIFIDFTKAFDLLWIDGLLLKMMGLGLKGNIYQWIKNFLINRHYQVKVNDTLSNSYSPDNGTPQGSVVSPTLFLLMLHDFPKLSNLTSDAFFADDCTIWRSGTNIEQIIFHLQHDLDLIDTWCAKWGFIINTKKTVGVLFTQKHISNDSITLKIQGTKINFQNSCKILGVFFDRRMTWLPHIEHISAKCTKSLNILRCVSGSNWGANKHILLTLYKALILSYLDYCCFTYDNCSKSTLKRLDTIQYKALLLVTGGLRGTALNALLSECGELPFE